MATYATTLQLGIVMSMARGKFAPFDEEYLYSEHQHGDAD